MTVRAYDKLITDVATCDTANIRLRNVILSMSRCSNGLGTLVSGDYVLPAHTSKSTVCGVLPSAFNADKRPLQTL